MPNTLEEWDEIERMLGAYDDDEGNMSGNEKQSHPVAGSIISGLVVGLVVFGCNYFFGDSRTLAAVAAKLEVMQKQVELLTSRPYISRDEFERELARLDRRLERVERELQSSVPIDRDRK